MLNSQGIESLHAVIVKWIWCELLKILIIILRYSHFIWLIFISAQ